MGVGGQPLPCAVVPRQLEERIGDARRTLGVDEQSRIARDLRHGADVRGDDRFAVCHGFDQRDAESLVERRQDQGGACLVDAREARRRDRPEVHDAVGESARRNMLCESRLPAVRPHEHEVVVVESSGDRTPEAVQCAEKVLARFLGADEQEERSTMFERLRWRKLTGRQHHRGDIRTTTERFDAVRRVRRDGDHPRRARQCHGHQHRVEYPVQRLHGLRRDAPDEVVDRYHRGDLA